MLVRTILNSKPSAEVVTLDTSASAADAAQLLSSKKIGAIVVCDDGATPIGILSERDIVRELGRRGSGCLMDPVLALMTKDPITCHPEDSSDKALEIMTEGRFRHLPVMQDAKMIGLISIGDVVKARLSELTMEKDALEGMIMGH